MPVDIYYTPKNGAAPVTLVEVQQRFAAGGISCVIEQDADVADMHWIVFEPESTTTICASTKREHLVFATVAASFHDDPQFSKKLDEVLEGMGFSAQNTD